MPLPLQNREFMRAEHELPVHYKHKGDEKFIGGIMRNYSEEGICFETGYPIRPGTDCAFLLAMLHSVLYEIGIFDVWFVKNRTNAPYLIGPDGYYVRDKTTGKPLLWVLEL